MSVLNFSTQKGHYCWRAKNNGDAEDLPVVHEGNYVCRLVFPAEFLAPRHYEVSIKAGIANVRASLAEPIRIHFDVEATGKFNRAYAGYVTPGKLAPLLEWKTELASPTRIQTLRNTSETLT